MCAIRSSTKAGGASVDDGDPLHDRCAAVDSFQSSRFGENSVRDSLCPCSVTHDGRMSHRLQLADDDRAIRESLERALELEGYAVNSVADGVQALSAIRREAPDVVVPDVMMPGVDGLGGPRRRDARSDSHADCQG